MLEEGQSSSLTRQGCKELRQMVEGIDLSSTSPEQAEVIRRAIKGVRPSIDEDGAPILSADLLQPGLRLERRTSLTQVRMALGGARFVYHGTTLGRLESIRQHGLLPDQAAVWREAHLQQHRESGVFFDDSFGGAENWACIAFSRCRGRRDSAKRRAIVLRLPTESLSLERDRRAMSLGCLVSREPVDASNAEWAFAGGGDVPRWRSISGQMASHELPELPILFRRI
jgi:hypothetical protein